MSAFPDLVILLPGITGSVLADGRGREVWGHSFGAIWRAITSRGETIEELELAEDGDPNGVTATRLIPGITIIPRFVKIDGYAAIERFLIRELELQPGRNFLTFPYDWRLDNRLNARRFEDKALNALREWRSRSGNVEARLVLIGHSMGGLISRYFLECLGGWQHTRTLITLGTPHWGSLNALDFLVHGMKKGIGPLGLDLTPLLRSFPSVYQLLPNYACVDVGDASLLGVADAVRNAHIPNVDEARARDSLAFHAEIEDAQKSNAKEAAYFDRGYRMVPLVGIEQPTLQSARCRSGKVELLRSLNGQDHGGDGTVPRVSATPLELVDQDREMFAAQIHGSMQNSREVLASVKGVVTQPEVTLTRLRHAGLGVDLTLDIEDVVAPGEPLTVRARVSEGNPRLTVELTNTQTNETQTDFLSRVGEWYEGEFEPQPGIWRVTVSAPDASPVSDLTVVAAP
jgi:pimeloyl-ACP methyl ester carboxylesterase